MTLASEGSIISSLQEQCPHRHIVIYTFIYIIKIKIFQTATYPTEELKIIEESR